MGDFAKDLVDSYRCPGWLRNGHANSIWAYLFKSAPKLDYRREVLETPDGDELHLDWTEPTSEPNDTTPLVVGCHGLEGSADAPYMRRLMASTRAKGWGGVALNYRGCAGENNRTVLAYHSGFTQDLELVLGHIHTILPRRPVYLVGYSLGGSIVANYLGRTGHGLRDSLRAAFLCSTPFLLAPGSKALRVGFNQVYEQKFLMTLRKKVAVKGRQLPEWQQQARIASRVSSIRDFDEHWIAPVFGFDSADDYYEKASSAANLRNIQIPTFALHANDDPFITADCVPESEFEAADNVSLGITGQGGHVGFVCAGDPHWLEEQALKWLGLHS